ncbi:putative F-box/FBD/LRR-repeat protein At5g22670 [Malania oleifera]|uniref:putative F-box/FBD/LRR-repeat protein At5g22670 n=1 Tax=Malania oleifera TaxID=397392 RepID=UPI0025AE72B1|nr:putative F-box/FBD/LRR-repeat protein At5g22670 [Malania oleifera]XP_057981547.1 putative F-box/FBD/LRR-repeat protein At5g22670 [Malania oleifera]
MDVSSSASSHKTPKLNEENDIDGEGRNVIDGLSDSLLQHILSFLPTRDAFRTSILSKRWECLWMSLPILDFKDETPFYGDLDQEALVKRVASMDFAERVLLFHLSTVTKFSLSCSVLHDWGRVNGWISAAVRRKVQVMDLTLKRVFDCFVLPCCLFTCESLQVLDLKMSFSLQLPKFAHFSNLRKLNLTLVIFPHDYIMKHLLAVCPVLEELELICCSWEHVKAVCIDAPRLKRFTLQENAGRCPDETDTEEEDGDGDGDTGHPKKLDGCQFAIFGAYLEYFSYSGNFANHYWFYGPSSMIEASIHLVQQGRRKVAYRAFRLLMGLTKSKSLNLSQMFVEVVTEYAEELLANLHEFQNLTHLECQWMNLCLHRKGLLTILGRSPRLSSLILSGELTSFQYDASEWTLDPVPACFSSHLKTIEISYICGSEHDLYVIKLLLESATVLEKFVVLLNPWELDMDFKKPQEIREQILLFPRASRKCVMEISCPQQPEIVFI